MCASSTKKKRAAPAQQAVATAQSTTINNLFDAYDFLATNEYSEQTIGVQAFVLRKFVGDINFAEVIDDSEKRNRLGQQINYVGILEDKCEALPLIDASIEKCLMLARLIYYIKNEPRFTQVISDIRLGMQFKMTDDHIASSSYDFGLREQEFNVRKTAQEVRRLFYHSDAEMSNPKNLVYLQNRTTEHLTSMMKKIPRDSKARQLFQNELESIFRSSFMIVAQPHTGVIPVTIYERKGPGLYTAKVSVVIISLLYDFMQLYPDVIELFDIEPSLCPQSDYYRLEEPRSLSWRPYHVQTGASGKIRTFLCAELSMITIEQTSKTDTRVRFAQLLHSFKFAIKLQVILADSKMPPVFQLPLESLIFSIGAHNSQIPQLLTRVIFEDMKRFSRVQSVNLETIQYYIRRYFIHRTGVLPNECVNIHLRQELTKAQSTNQKSNGQSLEDVCLEFLVNFVCQVEFMAKHPVLAMFHADGLFLGICNSERAAESITQSPASGFSVIGIRFNTIRIDYSAITPATSSSTAACRSVKIAPCAIRVDIYNDRTKKLQNRTFDSCKLAGDIGKFVASCKTAGADRIRTLSSFNDRTNASVCLSFEEFAKYHHTRLMDLLKDDDKYKPVTDLVYNANDGNTEDEVSEHNSRSRHNSSILSPNSIASWSPMPESVFGNDYSGDAHSVHEYGSTVYDSPTNNIGSPLNVLSPGNGPQSQQATYVNNQEAILKQILSHPDIAEQVMRQYGVGNTSTSMGLPQQVFQQPPMQYPTQLLSSQQQIPMQLPPQMTFPQPTSQSFQYQQQPQMQFQQPLIQQPPQTQFYQPAIQQQQRASSSVIHYHPQDTNQLLSSTHQAEQFQFVTTDDTQNMSQQFLEQIHVLNISNNDLDELAATCFEQQPPINNTATSMDNDPQFQQILEELKSVDSVDFNN